MATPVPHELVEAARGGGPREVESLVEAAWPDAYRLALAILGDRSAAEDAAQEACIILYRSVSSLRSAGAFRVWFYRVVVRAASGLKRRRDRVEPATPAPSDVADHAASMDIWRALSALPQKLRDVVVLRYFEDLTSREIASVLRIPDGTVRFRLMIAMRHLRPLVGDRPEPLAHPAAEVRAHAI